MEIREINNKEVWEGFLEKCEEKTFLSSWNWGEFQRKERNKIWRLGIYDGTDLVGVVLVVKVEAKRGTFLFVPHGPNIIFNFQFSIFKLIVKKIKEIAVQEKASFIRVAPIWTKNEENIKIFKDLGFINSPIHMHAEITWGLALFPNEENLLGGMRKTTRYLIRQAKKNKEIEIAQSRDIKDLELFNKVYQETIKRHHFIPFSLNYLRNQFLSFLPDSQISIFLGKYKGEVVSSAIIIYWQGIGFYHHGASLVKYNKVPVSYLLQWEAIKEAKKRGCWKYNFWGIAPVFSSEKTGISSLQSPISKQTQNSNNQNSKIEFIDKKHPWYGLTVFKTGFGGRKKEYLKTQDLPLSWKYWLTYFFEKLRKAKRGL